mgnify:CR=1 FL=1
MYVLPFELVARMCEWLDGVSMSQFRQVCSRCSAHRTSSHSLPDVHVMHVRMLEQYGTWAEECITPHMRSFLALCDTDGRVVEDRCCDLMWIACTSGDLNTMDVLSVPPFWSGQLDVNQLLACAFRHKHYHVFDRMVEAPFSMQTCDATTAELFLRHAIRFDDVYLLDRMTLPPFGVGHASVRVPMTHHFWSNIHTPIDLVCQIGAVGILSRMAESPFCITNEEIRANDNRIMRAIGHSGHAAILKRLSEAPFLFNGSDARTFDCELLRRAAEYGHVQILNVLATAPYSLCTDDARVCNGWALKIAAENGHVDVLKRLAAPPYCLTTSDAQSENNVALRLAAMNGHACIVDCLATWPYLLTQQDARSCNALHAAIVNGHARVVDRLSVAPFLIVY